MEAHKCRRTCFLAVTLIAVLQLAISSDAVAGLWRCNQSLSREVQPDHNTDNIMTVNTLNYNFSVDTERNIASDISKAGVPLQSNRTTNEVKIELENANVATSLTVEEQLLKKCSNLVPEFVFPTALDDPKFHQFQCKTVVVSVVLGDYDSFPFSIPKNSDVSIYGICWFVFMDWRSAVLVPEERRVSAVDLCPSCNVTMTKVNAWNVVFIPDAMMPLKSIGRNSRLFKMLIHRAFTHAEFLVYVDANMNLNPLSEKLISRYGRKTSNIEKMLASWVKEKLRWNDVHFAWASPRHPERCTAYQEGLFTCQKKLIGSNGVEQMHAYYKDGFPAVPKHYPGLLEGNYHVRNLKRVESQLLGCTWMEEYVRWNQPRDQLSFNYAAWKLSKSLLKSEDAFLHIGITHDNLLKRRRHSQRTQKREYVTTERCDELKVYSEECYHASKCKACTHEKKKSCLGAVVMHGTKQGKQTTNEDDDFNKKSLHSFFFGFPDGRTKGINIKATLKANIRQKLVSRRWLQWLFVWI